jgi:hypothetical protein
LISFVVLFVFSGGWFIFLFGTSWFSEFILCLCFTLIIDRVRENKRVKRA